MVPGAERDLAWEEQITSEADEEVHRLRTDSCDQSFQSLQRGPRRRGRLAVVDAALDEVVTDSPVRPKHTLPKMLSYPLGLCPNQRDLRPGLQKLLDTDMCWRT